MKILYVTTIGITMTFFKKLIRELLDEGHSVDIICNEDDEKVPDCYREWNCKVYHHTCTRSPLSRGNLYAIGQIENLVKEQRYDIVHCHTPIAAMCTRLACKILRKKTGVKVIYTAHGFHFYKGAPLVNWIVYYPIEKICSYWTDVLITINREDYNFSKRKMKATKTEYIPGVGIDIKKFKNTIVDREKKRNELDIPLDSYLILSVGELNENKNHKVILYALAELKNNNLYYAVAGEGPLQQYLLDLAEKLEIRDNVRILGYRKDVAEIYKISDLFCFPSIREGLPVALMEAMASDLPVIVSDNRGTRDLLINSTDYDIFQYDDISNISALINKFYTFSLEKATSNNLNEYSVEKINKQIKNIYNYWGRNKEL